MSCPPLVGHVGNAFVALSGLGTRQSYIPCLWVPSGLRCVLAICLLGFPLCLCMVSVAQAALGKLCRCAGFCDCQALFDCSRANCSQCNCRYNYLTTSGLPKHTSWPMNLACCPLIMSENPTGCFGLLGGALKVTAEVFLNPSSWYCSSLSYTICTESLSTSVLHQPPALPSALA